MINACVIGLGKRSYNLISKILLANNELNIIAVCDVYEDRIAKAIDCIKKHGNSPKGFTNYKDALNVAGLQAAFVFTGWEMHTEVAVYAMLKGIPVATEVGCEYTLDNCYKLVQTQESTKTPYMFMENCCWGKSELLATSMARHGMFGEIIHCSGAYGHDLRNEVAYGLENRHYRFENYRHRNCDNYPTHELGPIAKLLDINRGNRILTVSSFASKGVGLKAYIQNQSDASEEMRTANFKQGDIITTILTCANGETIRLQLDTTLPRTYSREFCVRGTKGMYTQDTNTVFLDGDEEYWNPAEYAEKHLNNAKHYEQEFLPRIWKDITPEMLAAGHGGMDWFAYKAFVDAVKNNTQMPIDVYDSAVWQAVSVLSEMSIIQGGAPQAMPDFTGGAWMHRPRLDVCIFEGE